MFTFVHISVTKWCIVGYDTGTLSDLWDWSINTNWLYPTGLIIHLPQRYWRLNTTTVYTAAEAQEPHLLTRINFYPSMNK